MPDIYGDYYTLCEYTDNGREVRIISADESGKPRTNNKGYAVLFKQFDKRNNLIEYSFFDENGCLCINNEEGIAGRETIYDTRDRIISVMSYDENRVPIRDKTDGIYIRKIEYKSNKIKVSYFDKEGNPMKSTFGYSDLHG